VKGHPFGARRLSLNFNRGIEIPHRLVDFQPEIALFYEITKKIGKLVERSYAFDFAIFDINGWG